MSYEENETEEIRSRGGLRENFIKELEITSFHFDNKTIEEETDE